MAATSQHAIQIHGGKKGHATMASKADRHVLYEDSVQCVEAEVDFIDDKAGKPVGIHRFIGRRPILAFGNSDGDLQMLQWTTSGPGRRLGLIVHHTDGEREVAYDRESPIGRLDEALDEASDRGWVVMDMKRDWETIFPAAP